MKEVNNKIIKSTYKRYLNSNISNILQAYKKPSTRKIKAYKYCEDLCKKYK